MAKDKSGTDQAAFLAELKEALSGIQSGDRSQVDATLTRLIERQQDRIAELAQENESLREQIPADGAVVLTAEEAETLESYRKLGEPDAITTKLEEADATATKLAENEARESWESAAETHGYNPSVLLPLARQGQLTVTETKTVQPEEGDPVDVVIVKAGEDGQPTRLDDYAKEHWPDFLPALTATADEDDGEGDRISRTPYPRQQEKGGGRKSLSIEEVQKKQRLSGRYAGI